MVPTERAKRVFISIGIGTCVAFINFGLDILFTHLGLEPAGTILNDLILGAAGAALAYVWIWASHQARKYERDVSAERVIRHEAVLQERQRFARELHDNLTQTLTGVILQLEASDETHDPRAASGIHARRALELARKAMRELRRSVMDLRPEVLDEEGLTSAITHVSDELADGTSLKIHLSFSGNIRRLPADAETTLLRISQEALTNVVKHSGARQAQVELCFNAQDAQLCVSDDGRGFQPDLRVRGFGLTSMEERAKALGGNWSVQSEPGRGTQVRASIPVPPAIQ